MRNNPDVYLLYEYMEKLPLTVRIKVQLDEKINASVLEEAANEAIERFPYYKVQVELDEGQNLILKENNKPITVLPEEDKPVMLGSDQVNRHLFAITYKDDEVYFNFSHAPCGAPGGLFWIKTTLYQYMTKKYGELTPPKDLKMVGSSVTDGELYFPNADELPKKEPKVRYTGGDSNLALGRYLKYLLNPFVKNSYYYQIEIPTKEFMEYAKSVDGSPNTIIAAILIKSLSKLFKRKKDTHLSARIAADYRDDIGASESYRDFVRFIHIRYEWDQMDEPIERLNMRARGAVIKQGIKELSFERFRRIQGIHDAVDEQPDLKSKKKHALSNSTFRSDPRDNCTVSYVGQVDWGEMEKHIKNVYTITDGDLMLEVNALEDHFCITYQVVGKDSKPVDLFCELLNEEKVTYKVSKRYTRYMPKIELPK